MDFIRDWLRSGDETAIAAALALVMAGLVVALSWVLVFARASG